jgi:5-methylthioadenosine/S-adenosylhomocysteine deaminase
MQVVDTLIYPRWIIPIEPHDAVLEQHAIAIQHGHITALLPAKEAALTYLAKETLHLPEHVVMPGLVNVHTHSAMTLFRGMADDLALMEWLENHIWMAERQWLSDEFVYDGTQLAILEMLRSGTTCFNDHYFYPSSVARAAVEAGMRAVIGPIIISFGSGYAITPDDYINKAIETYHAWQHPLIKTMFAPHSPYAVDDVTLLKIQQIADELALRVHLHLHETKNEIEQSLKDYNKRPLQRIADLGLVTEHLLCVHMTQVCDEDLAILQQKRPHIVHCPESNLKLASGLCPTTKFFQNDLNVALGTDGAASNNDLDMFAEMRTAALLAKVESNEPTAINAAAALRMATLNGARALGLENEIGSVVPGKWADLIAINLADINTQPVYHPSSHCVYALNSRQISDVWVAGKRLLKNGQFTQLDVKAIIAKANEWAEKFKMSKLD